MLQQLALFDSPETPALNWNEIDVALVSCSAGKDSIASIFAILDEGCPKEKIILVHQRIDGAPGEERGDAPANLLWDWPVTEVYLKDLAHHLGLPLYWQWREGGLSRELFRTNDVPAPVHFQHDGAEMILPTVGAVPNTRRKFPAQSASLMTRWCSSSVKIDPLARAITHEPTWQGTLSTPTKIAIVTGERREESAARAKYASLQPHKTSTKTRHVLQYRAILDWSEQSVWDCLRAHDIRPHPAYLAGYPRCSCRSCIFLDDRLWAMLRIIDPATFDAMAAAEEELAFTIDRNRSLLERVAQVPPVTLTDEEREAAGWALHPETFPGIYWPWPDHWYPSGAFRGSVGGSI